MAKVQVIITATLNGLLPPEDDTRMEWLRTDRRGFRHWQEAGVHKLYAGYPLTDLICEKEEKNNTATYLAEISCKESVNLLRGLFLYHIVDEIILYLLPVTIQDGIRVLDGFTASAWETVQVRHYRNGICRMVYRKMSQ